MGSLSQQQCDSSSPLLDETQTSLYLEELNSLWVHNKKTLCISRDFHFKNYYETMAFINAAAWVAHQQDHHPDMQISYNHCTITFTTHSVKGLSLNDFICAARINDIYS